MPQSEIRKVGGILIIGNLACPVVGRELFLVNWHLILLGRALENLYL